MSRCCEPPAHPARAPRRRLLAWATGLALSLAGGQALGEGHRAAAPVAEPFGPGSWAALQRATDQARRPQLVVFTATWCTVCPEVVASLQRDARRQRQQVPLRVVLTDVGPDELVGPTLAHLGALGQVEHLMAFDGPEAALRHSVDPRWRGLVPHLAWLRPGQPPEFVAGAPAAELLQRWWGAPGR